MSDPNQPKHRAEAVYISGGCNRCPKALDWAGPQDQIIYALNNSIALLTSREPCEITRTFNQHTDRVNSVRWITALGLEAEQKPALGLNEFVSASKDKTLVVWQGRDQHVRAVRLSGLLISSSFTCPCLAVRARSCPRRPLGQHMRDRRYVLSGNERRRPTAADHSSFGLSRLHRPHLGPT